MKSRRYFCRWLFTVLLLLLPSRALPVPKRMEMAITIDDLPSHGPLPAHMTRVGIAKSIIQTLKDNRVPRVYGFINAGRIEHDPASAPVLKLWIDAGFLLGNHTYAHRDINTTDVSVFEHDIEANEPLLKSLMRARDWHWFRYPFLRRGDTIEKRRTVRTYLHKHGYKIAHVTLDFQDYAWSAPYARCVAAGDSKAIEWLKTSYLDAAREYISLGQRMAYMLYGRNIKHVLLLHVGAFDSIMLPALLAQLKQQGVHFVSLRDAAADPAYRDDPDTDGGSMLDGLLQAKHLQYPPHAQKPLQALDSICR